MTLLLGQTVPNFTQASTHGEIDLYGYLKDAWGVLFSHPADFTPVCTTELGTVSRLMPEFEKRNVKVLALSVDPVDSHQKWVEDINETQATRVDYPIVADADRSVAKLYGMLPEGDAGSTLTVRSVFIIDPDKKLRLSLTYPASTGRNFQELLRVIDSMQMTDQHKVATPADWNPGDDVVIVPSLQDEAEIQRRFPAGYQTVRPYLRITKDPTRQS
jgi:thioredoxin-dependent peroxiredoxin